MTSLFDLNRRAFPLFFLLANASCAPAKDEPAESAESMLAESSAPRSGATIDSPSVDRAKRYWGARSLRVLREVSALTAVEESVARRADGINANTPANGSLGVDELARLESPEHSSSLFPEERAAIATLWRLLEIADVPPTNVTPAQLTPSERVSKLTTRIAATSPTARRVQLTCNDDSDPTTLSSADVACAYADRGSFTPTEIRELGALVRAIAQASPAPERAVSTMAATTTTVVHANGGVKVVLELTTEILGEWRMTQPFVLPGVRGAARLLVEPAGDTSLALVRLDPRTGAERVITAGDVLGLTTGARVEVWSAGRRVAEIDLVRAAGVQPIPFGAMVDIGGRRSFLSFDRRSDGATDVRERGSYLARDKPSSAPVVPAAVYRVEGDAAARFELYREGYGRYVTASSTAFCYPDIPDNTLTGLVTACRLLSSNGRVEATIAFAPPATATQDSPALAHLLAPGKAPAALWPL